MFCKVKINVQKKLEEQKLVRMAQQAQTNAMRSKTEQERAQHAFMALHYTLNAYKNMDIEERDAQVRILLNNSKEIFKNREARNGVRNEHISIKKDPTKKSATIKSKQFKDLKRIVLATGKMEESYMNLLSTNPKEQSRGNKKFQQALKKMQKVDCAEWKPFCKQIAQAKYIELSLAPFSKNVQIPSEYLTKINTLKDTL
jgi:hypothetical protein